MKAGVLPRPLDVPRPCDRNTTKRPSKGLSCTVEPIGSLNFTAPRPRLHDRTEDGLWKSRSTSLVTVTFGSGRFHILLLAMADHIQIQPSLPRREWHGSLPLPSIIPLSRTQIIKEDGFAFTSEHPRLRRKCPPSTYPTLFWHLRSSWIATLIRSVKTVFL